MHLKNSRSLCVAGFFARTTAVNLHLSDENTNSTMLRWWYVSSNSSGFFLPPEHLCPWTESIYHMVLAGADHRPPAGIADHPVVLVCIVSCIKHYASCAIRNLFDHLLKRRRIMHPSPDNCTGCDLSPLYVSNYVQFDEFAPRDDASLGILPLSIPNYGNHGGVAQQ